MGASVSSAVGGYSVDPYKRLVKPFSFYGAYHTNPINQWIHIVCVPVLLSTGLLFFSYIPILSPRSSSRSLLSPSSSSRMDASVPIAVAYGTYYLYLSPSPLGIAGVGMVSGLYAMAHALKSSAMGALVWKPAIVVHVLSWVAQFYGHGHYEGRKPALIDNLFQSIFMAPFFVLIETGFKLGLLQQFKAEVDPEIDRLVKEFHDSDNVQCDDGGTACSNNDDGDSWIVEKKRHGHTTAQTVVVEKAVVEVDNPFDVLAEDDEEKETVLVDLNEGMNKKKKKFWLF